MPQAAGSGKLTSYNSLRPREGPGSQDARSQKVCAADPDPDLPAEGRTAGQGACFLLPCLAGGGWSCFIQQGPGGWVCLQRDYGLHVHPGTRGFLSSSTSPRTLCVGQWTENHLLPSPRARGQRPSPSPTSASHCLGTPLCWASVSCPTTLQGHGGGEHLVVARGGLLCLPAWSWAPPAGPQFPLGGAGLGFPQDGVPPLWVFLFPMGLTTSCTQEPPLCLLSRGGPVPATLRRGQGRRELPEDPAGSPAVPGRRARLREVKGLAGGPTARRRGSQEKASQGQ